MSTHGEWPILLNCVGCGAFTEWEAESETVVACADCGKRHSRDSLHMVNPRKVGSYERDEVGTLLEDPP